MTLFSQPYNREEFLNFLRRDFLPEDFEQEQTNVEFATKTTYSQRATKLGICKSLDLVVYEVIHTGKDDPRVGLSKEAFRMLSEEWQDRALVLFVPQDNPANYRFSLIEVKLEGDESTAKVHRKYSNPRRYSYLLGVGIGGYTPNQYLAKGRVKNEKDLFDRFSVEILTKAFYNELSDWYAWAIDEVEFPGMRLIEEADKKNEHKSKNVIRLLTRLLFVWFLKQKRLIPDELFDIEYLSKSILKNFDPHLQSGLFNHKSKESLYYKAILQNLFFATLNCPITPQSSEDKRERGFRKMDNWGQNFGHDHLMRYEKYFSNSAHFLELVNERVPFLNGGLFDCLDDKEHKIYIDGFSDNLIKPNQLIVPDYLFFGEVEGKGRDVSVFYGDKKKSKTDILGLIDILKKYNFTIEENMPFDQEVSLDPELLGKVFENLLASYNPETKTTARKQTGSFYTPREIVQYMVDESLVAHLKRTVGEELEDKYRQLMQYTDEDLGLTNAQKSDIIRSLQNCKVLDPACGSGAFPVGVLQQMVHILSQLDPRNEIWKDLILDESVRELGSTLRDCTEEERKEVQDDINRNFDDSINRPDYARKLYLIEKCIYGVDIQSIAVQISKLRFFISLVVDQKPTSDKTDNFGIRPLPNLEAKFVAANTLIGLKKEKNLFDDREIDKLQAKLTQASHRIFGAKSNRSKNRWKERVEELQAQIAKKLEVLSVVSPEDARLMRGWKMFDQNGSSPFFDPEWMFGVSDGFDIVIGNPPYIQLQANGGALANQLKDAKYETFARTGDIYCVFYERGLQILRDGGVETYITSNKWMRAGYGEKTRAYFAKNNPLRLLDLGAGVFESATVDTNILIIQKGSNQNQLLAASTDKTDLSEVQFGSMSVSGGDIWTILSPVEQSIKQKIEAIGTPLKDWDVEIYRGVLTGYNEAFIITSEKRSEILAACCDTAERERTEQLIKPILRGRDIKRYSASWAGLWLIATFPALKLDIEHYPAVKLYLESFGERLHQTGAKNIDAINGNNARKKTGNKWFETQDQIGYYKECEKEKIIWKRIGSILRFCYDDTGCAILDSTCIATGDNIKYLVAILNSKMGNYLLKDAPKTGTGDLLISVQALEPICIPKLSLSTCQSFIDLADKILEAKKSDPHADTTALENKIDFMVYKLYGLTYNEVLTIDPKTSITQQQYEL